VAVVVGLASLSEMGGIRTSAESVRGDALADEWLGTIRSGHSLDAGRTRDPEPTRPSASWGTLRGSRQHHQGHHVDRAADEPARVERHHRGGPRGRGRQGFAVVASEVKELAQETAQATEDVMG
jgi:hypothetical protein